jgi:transposase
VLVNMRQVLERWLAGAHARLRCLPPSPGTPADTQPARRTRPFARTRAERAARVGRRERWIALYEEVRRRHAAGEALQAISRAMNLAVGTVRKYAAAESFPVPEGRPLRSSILDPYLAHLQARLAEGCENALALWRELRAAGFPGTANQVQRWVAEHRTAPAPSTPHRWRTKAPAHTPKSASHDGAPALPSPRQLAWLLIQPPSALSMSDAALVARVEQDPTAAHVAGLARRLTALVRGCGVNPKVDPEAARMALNAWLADARRSGIRALETFAAGLEQDGAAIQAALTTPWSSGQAEGQITRLKLIKRQMYGHASFDLLRRRVLLAA